MPDDLASFGLDWNHCRSKERADLRQDAEPLIRDLLPQ
jgi:hypothetical protein